MANDLVNRERYTNSVDKKLLAKFKFVSNQVRISQSKLLDEAFQLLLNKYRFNDLKKEFFSDMCRDLMRADLSEYKGTMVEVDQDALDYLKDNWLGDGVDVRKTSPNAIVFDFFGENVVIANHHQYGWNLNPYFLGEWDFPYIEINEAIKQVIDDEVKQIQTENKWIETKQSSEVCACGTHYSHSYTFELANEKIGKAQVEEYYDGELWGFIEEELQKFKQTKTVVEVYRCKNCGLIEVHAKSNNKLDTPKV